MFFRKQKTGTLNNILEGGGTEERISNPSAVKKRNAWLTLQQWDNWGRKLWRTQKKNSVPLVRERTIPTERPPPVGEVSANFCG